MTARVSLVVLASLIVGLCMPTASAQAQDQQFLRIVQFVVQPSQAAQFEEVTRQAVEQLGKEKSKDTGFLCMRSEEVVYTFILPVTSIADRARQDNALAQAGQSLGSDWAERAADAVEYTNEFLAVSRPDLSYTSESPRLSPGEIRHMHFDFHYLNFGKEQQAEQTAKAYAALHKKVNCNTGFEVYEVLGGSELPILIVATGALSLADYYTQAEKVLEHLGSGAADVAASRDAVVRRIERIDSTVLPELSYQPATASGG